MPATVAPRGATVAAGGTPRERRATFVGHAVVDGLVVGGAAVLLWVAAVVSRSAGLAEFDLNGGAVVWTATAASAAHFVLSFRLAYAGDRAIWRHRWVGLVAVPLTLGIATVAVVAFARGEVNSVATTEGLSVVVSVVFVLSGYHYVRQAFGVVLLASGLAGIRLGRRETAVLRHAALPAWVAGLRFGPWMAALPHAIRGSIEDLVLVTASVGAVVATSVFVVVRRRTPNGLPAAMVAPLLASYLWLVFPLGIAGSAAVLAGLHGAQFLACWNVAERQRGAPGRPGQAARRRAFVVATAALAGVLIVGPLPSVLDRRYSLPGAPGSAALLLSFLLNLTHYLTDSLVWRSDAPVLRSIREA